MAKYTDDIAMASRFLASTLHEIRTPIQTIISTVELLHDTHLDTEQTEHVRQIQFSADVLLNLANTVLDMAKIRAGEFSLESIPFDVAALSEQVVDLIAIEAFNRGLEVIVDIADDVPPLVMGDPVRVQQILLNLVKNAVKFTQQGYILVELSMRDGMVYFSVTDSGIGLSPEQQERVFDDYYQADVSTYRKYGGTGLGLSICRQLVSLMHGTIGVKANASGGSIFWFTLPLAPVAVPAKPLSFLWPPHTRILIATEKLFSAHILQKKLGRLGLSSVTISQTPDEALSALRKAAADNRPFTVAFVDMLVSSFDGFHLASLINDDKKLSETRLYLLVSEGQLGGEAKMKMLNWFDGYLYKPVKRQKLAELLNEPYTRQAVDIPELRPVEDEHVAQGKKLLIAEDHAVNRLLLSSFLQKFGAEVFLAEDGQQAVRMVSEHPDIDLIFMDIQMPVMNGVEATSVLRENKFGGIIIACTANNDEGDFAAYKKIGINDILVKPFKSAKIKSMLEKWNTVMEIAVPEKVTRLASERLRTLALWDRAEFMDTVAGDTALARQRLDEFVAQTEACLVQLPSLIVEHDFSRLRTLACTCKTGSETVASPLLAEYAARLAAAAKATDIALGEQHMHRFISEFVKFKTLAEKWKKTL